MNFAGLALVTCLFCALPALADIFEAVPFTPVVFPNIPEQSAPPGSGFMYIVASTTVPTGINDNGQIVGQFQSLDCCETSGLQPQGTLGFVYSNGSYNGFYAISANGQPVTCFYCGNPADFPGVYPTGINNSGTIAGNYPDGFFDTYGFAIPVNLSGASPIPVELSSIVYPGLPVGNGSTWISGINNSGEMIGVTATNVSLEPTGGDPYPWEIGGFLYDDDNFTNLSYTPLAINNLGQIVGENGIGQIIVDTNGNIQNLGFFPFTPTGFNDAGVIVGGDYTYSDGTFTQIQLQGETGGQVQINAINDRNEMVGTYTGSGGEIGFAATPEPGALYVLIAGLCGIAIRRRVRADSRSG